MRKPLTEVNSSCAAAKAGLQRGNIIQEVNRKPVKDVEQYHEALSGVEAQSVLLLGEPRRNNALSDCAAAVMTAEANAAGSCES